MVGPYINKLKEGCRSLATKLCSKQMFSNWGHQIWNTAPLQHSPNTEIVEKKKFFPASNANNTSLTKEQKAVIVQTERKQNQAGHSLSIKGGTAPTEVSQCQREQYVSFDLRLSTAGQCSSTIASCAHPDTDHEN